MGNTQRNLKRERTAYWFNEKCWDTDLKSIKHLKRGFYIEKNVLFYLWGDAIELKKRQNFYAKISSFHKATHTWNNRHLFVSCRKACGNKRNLYSFLQMCLFSAFFLFYFEKRYYLTIRSVNYYPYWLFHFIALQRHYMWTLFTALHQKHPSLICKGSRIEIWESTESKEKFRRSKADIHTGMSRETVPANLDMLQMDIFEHWFIWY